LLSSAIRAWIYLGSGNLTGPGFANQMTFQGGNLEAGVVFATDVLRWYPANYPVRQMMQLVENIAAKQTSVSEADWVTWCTRLEQCLIQAAGSNVLEEFLKLNLNPLSPLWHSPFRPHFATTAETNEGRRYEETLKRVEAAWNVAGLSKIGDQA
jgi:hypothetical protein